MLEFGAPNHVWTYDFMFDATLGGRRMKVLSNIQPGKPWQNSFGESFNWSMCRNHTEEIHTAMCTFRSGPTHFGALVTVP